MVSQEGVDETSGEMVGYRAPAAAWILDDVGLQTLKREDHRRNSVDKWEDNRLWTDADSAKT